MANIGTFTAQNDSFTGTVRTLTLNVKVKFIPNAKESENAPDYRLHQGNDDGPEIGAGWKRTGERAGEYIAFLIDDPALPQPIRANLFRDDDAGSAWSLHWSRPQKRDGKD